MEKMSRADMQIKVRTPIGLLLVLSFLGKWLLDTFEEGRVILETLPPVLAFLARPFPSFVLLLIGIALILWELQSIRKVRDEPQKRQLRHYLIGSGISFVGLLIILAVVATVGTLLSRHEQTTKSSLGTTPAPSTATPPNATATAPESETETRDSTPSKDKPVRPSKPQKARSTAPAPQAPPMSQECAPGANCAMSNGQQGGITAGAINVGSLTRTISDAQVDKLSSLLSEHRASVSIGVHNPGGDTEGYANRWLLVFHKAKWSTAGVDKIMSGTAIGPDGSPVPIPKGIHIYYKAAQRELAEFVVTTIGHEGIPCNPPEPAPDIGDIDLNLFVGDQEEPNQGSFVQQSNSGGINVQQVTTGQHSPIINSPITVGDAPKRISSQDRAAITQFLSSAKNKARVKVVALQGSNTRPFADDFYDAFKSGQWEMPDAGVEEMIGFGPPGPKYKGAVAIIRGQPLGPGEKVESANGDPLFYVGRVLERLKVPAILKRDPNVEEGLILVQFEGLPD